MLTYSKLQSYNCLISLQNIFTSTSSPLSIFKSFTSYECCNYNIDTGHIYRLCIWSIPLASISQKSLLYLNYLYFIKASLTHFLVLLMNRLQMKLVSCIWRNKKDTLDKSHSLREKKQQMPILFCIDLPKFET